MLTRFHRNEVQTPTAENLWKAVRDWEPNPLSGLPTADPGSIFKLIVSPSFGPVPLGELHHNGGVYPCALLPIATGLGPPLDAYEPPDLRYSSKELAINYADGFPLEENPGISINREMPPNEEYLFNADTDPVLRRFISLGYITMLMPHGEWVKTGHVLVLDADCGRNCHPWIVLASRWDSEDEAIQIAGGETIITAPEIVKPNDDKTPGVLPGDHNRTPIARLDPLHPVSGGRKLVEYFGPEYKFVAERFGRESIATTRKPYGPSLVEIMEWYWDPVEQLEEVCYTKNGQRWYNYNKDTRKYRGPSFIPPEKVGNLLEPARRDLTDSMTGGTGRGIGRGIGPAHSSSHPRVSQSTRSTDASSAY